VPHDELEPNVRLFRHYQAMGAVSRPRRAGKEARYDYRHVLEVLVIRRLLEQGWRLRRIADITAAATEGELLAMLDTTDSSGAPTRTGLNPAQELVRRFAADTVAEPTPTFSSAVSSRADDMAADARASVKSEPRARIARTRHVVEMRLPYDVRVSIDAGSLGKLSPQHIEEIAEAVARGLRVAQRDMKR
jgi:DNA-binding transcriptional MerR regulator